MGSPLFAHTASRRRRYPGKVALFGSGESAPSGRAVHERLLAELEPPVSIAILETPAGFQPNSYAVATQVRDFMLAHLQNYHPDVVVVPARRKGTPFTPDDPQIVAPLLKANYIFMGPGSATYAVRHLEGTLAWRHTLEQHRQGSALCFASAGALAVGTWVLPVYEVFKAGADPHWVRGLDLFGRYGLDLAIVPHWNNAEGGAGLDTSRCFMGRSRFEELLALLTSSTRVLGIDEHTAVMFDFSRGMAQVQGKGVATLLGSQDEHRYPRGSSFPLAALGDYQAPLPLDVLEPSGMRDREQATEGLSPPVVRLMRQREEARRARDWPQADALRRQLAELGFEVQDTREGPRWRRAGRPGEVWQPLDVPRAYEERRAANE
ncbi:MAG: hypothetical protein HY683_00755 [Chloroflexi bacterium]|nr:hypothetical protein [Chloroflexota bacterium]